MKVLDISSFYSDNGGGVRTYHQQKLQYFKQHPEHRYVMVISGNRPSREIIPGGTVYRLKGFPVTKNADYRQICDYLYLKRILEKERPDIIEIGSIYLDNWLALIGAMNLCAAKVSLYHADFPDSYLAPAVAGFPRGIANRFVSFWHWYVKFACSKMDATCVTSNYIQDKLNRMGVNNILHIPLGVDTDQFTPPNRVSAIREELRIGINEKFLLYVGRFSTEKGIETMMKALPSISATPGRQVVLAGGGPLEGMVRNQTVGMKNVQVLPFIRNTDYLKALYSSADVFLSPGPYETFGLATLEALASGLPVVAANKGGAAELVQKCEGGMLFESQNPNAMISVVNEMLSGDLRQMSRRARDNATKFYSWNNTFDTMILSYEKLLQKKRHQRNEKTGLRPWIQYASSTQCPREQIGR